MKHFRRFSSLVLLSLLVVCPAVKSFGQEAVKAAADGRQTTPAANSSEAKEEDETAVYRHSAMVGKIGHMLGMSTDTAGTVFEVFNFAVLAFGILFLAGKALPKILRERSSGIQKDLTDARSATEEASVRLNSVEERLAKLDAQIAAMHSQAEKDALLEEQRLRAAAEEEKRKILASAEQEIAAAGALAQRQLQQYAAGLAIEHAAQRLVISEETDRQLVRTFTQRLGEGGTRGQN